MMRSLQITYWLVAFFVASSVAIANPKITSINGRIVAFRPTQRIGQVVSGVINREIFLLRTNGKSGEIVKVVYEHQGESRISTGKINLKVRRDLFCDGDYGHFVSEAPVLTSEDKSNSIPKVTTLDGFTGLPPGSPLKCFRLGDAGVDAKNRN